MVINAHNLGTTIRALKEKNDGLEQYETPRLPYPTRDPQTGHKIFVTMKLCGRINSKVPVRKKSPHSMHAIAIVNS